MNENALPRKITFHAFCLMYRIDYDVFESIAYKACLTTNVVKNMFVGTAVQRNDVTSVLANLSQMIGDIRTLENTSVLLLPDDDTGGTHG